MTYLPRRLRKSAQPRWVLVTQGPIDLETATRIRRDWRAALRRPGPVVIDGTRIEVRRLP